MKTIQHVEDELQQKLQAILAELDLLPPGFTAFPRLHGKSRDKKRSAAFEGNWHPETDSIYVTFEVVHETKTGQVSVPSAGEPITNSLKPSAAPDSALADLIRALDHAESRPGFNFVALKWFRDTALVNEGFAWTNVESARKRLLSEAIERRLILTNSVPNPKSPQFPVTSIRLNRLMPEVIAVLGDRDNRMPDFQPVVIRGENLSTTVLRDRR